MRVFIVLALAWCCSGQFMVPYNAMQHPFAVQYDTADAFGQRTYGHQTFDQARHEIRLADGRVIGQFSYIDANGEPAVTYFEAGPKGYRVKSNILPEAPTADLQLPVDNLEAPKPVEYTPEVLKAREEFMKLYRQAEKPVEEPDVTPVKETDEDGPEDSETETTSRKKRQVFFFPADTTDQTFFRAASPTIDDEEEPSDGTFAFPHPLMYIPGQHFNQRVFTHPTGFPFGFTYPSIVTKPAEVATTDTVERTKRDVSTIPLPYLYAVPAETKATFQTKQFETVEADTPADTTKLELITKDHVFNIPTVKYVQPSVKFVNPLTYTAQYPQVSPYSGFMPFHPFAFPGLPSPAILTPAPKVE